MKAETAIEIKNLWKRFVVPHEKRTTVFENLANMNRRITYEEFWALKNINLSVAKGEAVGIIGENGSGKTTLLNIIANVLRSTKGEVRVNGKLTCFLELGVGFQSDLTARENVYLYGAFMGLSDSEIDRKLNDIVEFAGLKKFMDTKLKNLSSGMQVRLAFSTAIQTNPDILLVDEVLAVGDLEFQQKCAEKFSEFKRNGVTLLLVSHDLGVVRKYCDKVLLLRKGEQIALGRSEDVIDKYVYGIDKTTTTKQDKKARWGDGRVLLKDVRFYDKFGKQSSNFVSGDPMTIRISYHAAKDVINPVFGVAIYTDNDIYCYGVNTDLKGMNIKKIKGSGHIDLNIEKLTMHGGRYLLTVAVHSRDHVPYDWLDKQFSFNVTQKNNNAGLFEIPCEWKLEE
ncbi:MAG: ABC-type polysaccharide/polyol phosphate transport system, ATPase component [Candidatus Fermentimicrarchaeum limneticum]|uniref:ABC-type polysaccharide/polyol phosphate transport system, ATPase component n=1 Tax=Fermentimicrarchaeum limneticum TaxID=2795018 RepID=A0A7D5XL00_FERL1|nr:MAG: ABC-type polysaccharide/polyol phosphate transport system, ATPase component [Candidatus Fermentimicrarchaeum limneticum]